MHMRFRNSIDEVRAPATLKINLFKSFEKTLIFNRFLIRNIFCKYFTAIQWHLCYEIKGSLKLFYISAPGNIWVLNRWGGYRIQVLMELRVQLQLLPTGVFKNFKCFVNSMRG